MCFQFVHVDQMYSLFLELRCPAFQKPKGVIVQPSICGLEQSKYGTMCRLSCPNGFLLSGVTEEVRCLHTGKWSENVQIAFCKGMDIDNNLLWLKEKSFKNVLKKGINNNVKIREAKIEIISNSTVLPIKKSVFVCTC